MPGYFLLTFSQIASCSSLFFLNSPSSISLRFRVRLAHFFRIYVLISTIDLNYWPVYLVFSVIFFGYNACFAFIMHLSKSFVKLVPQKIFSELNSPS